MCSRLLTRSVPMRSITTATRTWRLPATSVWSTFTPLAQKHDAVNLGQGFPSFEPPSIIMKAAHGALERNVTQYTRTFGHQRLVDVIAKHMGTSLGRQLDAQSEILVTVGATEALLLAALATLDQGDHAMLIEPFYDSYAEQVRLAGAESIHVRMQRGEALSADAWTLPFEEMVIFNCRFCASLIDAVQENKLTPLTKVLFFNNPSNIPGKVHTRAELERLAKFAVDNDLIVVADEVYDILTYDGHKHIRLASLPGMADRTITICSAGKMFSTTGFKVGWAMATPKLIDAMARVHTYVSFCVASPLQEAVADALERADGENYFETMRKEFDAKRHHLMDMLRDVNLKPIVPQGSYFVLADASHVDPSRFKRAESKHALDWQFCEWLTQSGGVCAIPPSAFYRQPPNDVLARFAFCKTEQQFDEARRRLKQLKL